MAGRGPRGGDLVSGAALAGLGLYVVLEARGWEYLGADGPGPGFFPLWYGIAMLALALLLVATATRGGSPGSPAGGGSGIGRALIAWVALAVCAGLTPLFGFLITFALFTLFVVAVMYRRPLLPAVAIAVGCAAVFYLLFPVALNVALPKGVLGF